MAWPSSIRFRLIFWYLVVLATILMMFSLGVYYLTRASLRGELTEHMNDQLALLDETLRDSPAAGSFDNLRRAIPLFEVTVEDSTIYRTDEWSTRGLDQAIDLEPAVAVSAGPWTLLTDDKASYRMQSAVLQVNKRAYTITIAHSEDAVDESLQSLRLVLIVVLPIAVALAFLGGSFMTSRALAPIGTMAEKASKLTAERLSERLPVDNPDDELGQLAEVFNMMLLRLEESFEAQRRFAEHASHELRTPLTAIRAVGEVGLQEGADTTTYRDVIGSMLEETDHLSRLIDDLLMLSRADSKLVQIAATSVDLADLAEEVVGFLRVLAEERQQTLRFEAKGPVHGLVDRSTVRQALVNIVDNAINHCPMTTRINVVVSSNLDGTAVIEVTDDGPGIEPKHLKRIFERFYHVDRTVTKSHRSVGLGLAIAQWAVEANGGRIEVSSQHGQGSNFRIILPAAS